MRFLKKIQLMIHRLVKMSFKANRVKHFLELFEASKDKIAAFDGCHELRLLNDRMNPNVFFTYSVWETEEHLNEYKKSELFKITWKQTKALFDIPAEAWSTDILYVEQKH